VEQRRVQWGLLVGIVLVAAVLRVYQLKDVPAGFFCDEAGLGYNAYSIARAGVDENGRKFPLFVWSFGVSYKNPVFIYSAIVPISIFGLDEFSVRLTSAIYGIATVLGIFFLGRALFTPAVGLLAAAFLAVCPWHLHFSRIAFELISFAFLFVAGLTFLVRFTQGRRTLAAGLLLLGACIYAYAIAYLFVPLFLLGFGLLYLPLLLRRWRETALAMLVLLATVAPAATFLHQNQMTGTRYFRATTNLRPEQGAQEQIERLVANYQTFFSRQFLFESGDPIVRHAVKGFGELLPFYAPFLVLGALVCLFDRNRTSKLVLWWLALYPLGPSLMTEIPSASRGFIGAPAFCLLSGVGLASVLQLLAWIGRVRAVALGLQALALGAAAYFLAPQVSAYLRAYFIEYPKYSAPTYGGFQYGYRDAIHYMESRRQDYDLLMLTATQVNQPQIFPLFYNALDPREWQGRRDLGYLILDPSEYSRYSMDQRILYALRPSDLDIFTDYTVHREIVAPGGQVEFVVAEVRARRRFLKEWLGLGLFDNEERRGLDHDPIDPRHLPTGPLRGSFAEIKWEPIRQQFVRVDLNAHYYNSHPKYPGNPEWACAYAVTSIDSEGAKDAYLEVSGSDDAIQVWLNEDTLTPWPLSLGETPRRKPIRLAAGRNALLVKSCELIGSWFFTMRITDADGRDLDGITARAEVPLDDSTPVNTTDASHAEQLVEGFDSVLRFKSPHSAYPGYRGSAESWSAAVRDEGSELVWRSRPCPDRRPTVLAFTASMSDERGRADLFVNGTLALTFDLGAVGDVRQWTTGAYSLSFASKMHIAGNSGVMLLQIPAEHVTPGESVEIRVVPNAGHPDAWFMVQSYPDTISKEGLTVQRALAALRTPWTS
jgi:4-amino-4-deoxy-L-arabinose transferase-like glycosyltransferase